MPNVAAFARKHAYRARTQGVRPAAREATAEAAMYVYGHVHDRLYDQGRLIWDDDWDICCVVDACRWDCWNAVVDGEQWPTGEYAWSAGSASPEWYGETFQPDVLPDEQIGLVTANPFASKPSERMPKLLQGATPVHEQLAYCDYVFEDSWGCDVDSGYLDVTHPGDVTARAFSAWQSHGLDRLVVHYMQPHLPFRARPEWFATRENLDDFGEGRKPYASGGKEIWKQVRDGERERAEVWDAYCDNLQWVLDDIDRLRTSVDARMLVTSDHGNGLGEWGVWSHPPKCPIPAVRKVPWVFVDCYADQEFQPRDEANSGVEKSTEAKLKALGYLCER